MLQTPSLPRSTFSEQPEGLRISIPPPRKLVPAIFIAVWLIGWSFGLIDVGRKVIANPFDSLFDTVWFCGWTIGGAFFLIYWFWNLFGQIEVNVRADAITIRHLLFAISRTRTFTTNEMFNLRFVTSLGSGKGRRASHIAFDYGAKTIRFADEIEEAEGNMIIHRIHERAAVRNLPSYSEL